MSEPLPLVFDRLNQRKTRAVLNLLTESTFFYRDDDPDSFDFLRRRRADFERFFEDQFGWGLHVDRKCARLFKRATVNPRLTRKQRGLFDLTRREECILFMLLLEFHELQLAAQNAHAEHDEDLNFLLADFVNHAIARFREAVEERAPTDVELLSHVRSLFAELERHRFLRLVERENAAPGEAPAGLTEHVLYEFLPGMHTYDPSALNASIFARAYGLSAEEDAPTGGDDVEGEAPQSAGSPGGDP